MRRLLRLLVTAVSMTALLVFPTAVPSSAGVGPSQQCDGAGAREVEVIQSPISVSILLFAPETDVTNHLIICYSTTPEGTGDAVTGGAVVVYYGYESFDGGDWQGAYLNVYCQPDDSIVLGPDCTLANGVFANTDYLPSVETTEEGGLCVVPLGSTCIVFIPGITPHPGTAPWLLDVILLGRECPLPNPGYLDYCVQQLTGL